jgi:hypothetical protein
VNVGGCFTASDAAVLNVDHTNPSAPPYAQSWKDSVAYLPDWANFGQGATVNINDEAPYIGGTGTAFVNGQTVPALQSWYVEYNLGAGAADRSVPEYLQNGNPIPQGIAELPSFYPSQRPNSAVNWPPAHVTAWHFVPPNTSLVATWDVIGPPDLAGNYQQLHSDAFTFACPPAIQGLTLPPAGPLDARELDLDKDGFIGFDDCIDNDPTVYPGAPDVPGDGVDADCAGDHENDADGDLYPDAAWGGLDCDGSDPTVYPGAPEIPDDGIDQDCDGSDLIVSPPTLDDVCDCQDDDGDGEIDEDCTYDVLLYAEGNLDMEVWLDGVSLGTDASFNTFAWSGFVNGGTHHLAAEVTHNGPNPEPVGWRAAVLVNGDVIATPMNTTADSGNVSAWQTAPLATPVGPAPCSYPMPGGELDGLGAQFVWLGACNAVDPTPMDNQFVLTFDVCGP